MWSRKGLISGPWWMVALNGRKFKNRKSWDENRIVMGHVWHVSGRAFEPRVRYPMLKVLWWERFLRWHRTLELWELFSGVRYGSIPGYLVIITVYEIMSEFPAVLQCLSCFLLVRNHPLGMAWFGVTSAVPRISYGGDWAFTRRWRHAKGGGCSTFAKPIQWERMNKDSRWKVML